MEVIKPIDLFQSKGDSKINNNYNNYKTTSNENEILILEIDQLNNSEKKYTIDEQGNVSLIVMNKELEDKIKLLQEECEKEGIDILIKEDIRTIERQNELYRKGREQDEDGNWIKTGRTVTNAKGEDYSSMHQWGIAFDICINNKSDPYNKEKLAKVGEIGKKIGLEWGGDWKSIVDTPHFQLKTVKLNDGRTINCSIDGSTNLLKEKYGTPDKFADNWY